jgi:hypothetical protein
VTAPAPVDPREVAADDLLVQRLARRRPAAGRVAAELAGWCAQVDARLDETAARISAAVLAVQR